MIVVVVVVVAAAAAAVAAVAAAKDSAAMVTGNVPIPVAAIQIFPGDNNAIVVEKINLVDQAVVAETVVLVVEGVSIISGMTTSSLLPFCFPPSIIECKRL